MEHDDLASLPDEAIIRIESKLFKTYARLAAIVDSSSDAIVGLNKNAIITSWNKAARTIYDYENDEAIGKNINFLWPTANAPDTIELTEKALRGDPVKDYETIHIKKDGRQIFVSLTLSSVKDDLEQAIGFSMISRDITDKKLAEEKLGKFDEVNRLNRLMIDREVKMVELKQRIKDLEDKLNTHEMKSEKKSAT